MPRECPGRVHHGADLILSRLGVGFAKHFDFDAASESAGVELVEDDSSTFMPATCRPCKPVVSRIRSTIFGLDCKRCAKVAMTVRRLPSNQPVDFFDDKYGMDATSLQRVLGKTLTAHVDHADLYFQYQVSDTVSLEEGAVKQASKHIDQGVGVRALAGDKTGYAFSDEITVSNLELAAQTARRLPAVAPPPEASPSRAYAGPTRTCTRCRPQDRTFP